MAQPRGLLQTINHGVAERLAADPLIPPESRAAFRATAITVFEQQVSAVVGTDTLRITGWVMPPSVRQDRRDRIEQALLAGETPKAIAGRELVSERYVRKLRAEIAGAGTDAP